MDNSQAACCIFPWPDLLVLCCSLICCYLPCSFLLFPYQQSQINDLNNQISDLQVQITQAEKRLEEEEEEKEREAAQIAYGKKLKKTERENEFLRQEVLMMRHLLASDKTNPEVVEKIESMLKARETAVKDQDDDRKKLELEVRVLQGQIELERQKAENALKAAEEKEEQAVQRIRDAESKRREVEMQLDIRQSKMEMLERQCKYLRDAEQRARVSDQATADANRKCRDLEDAAKTAERVHNEAVATLKSEIESLHKQLLSASSNSGTSSPTKDGVASMLKCVILHFLPQFVPILPVNSTVYSSTLLVIVLDWMKRRRHQSTRGRPEHLLALNWQIPSILLTDYHWLKRKSPR